MEAPLGVQMVPDAPMMIPFRVWVLQGYDNGRVVSGHYEYFEMIMDQGTKLGLLSPTMNAEFLPVPLPKGTNTSIPR